MKNKSTSKHGTGRRSLAIGGFFMFRLLIGVVLCFTGVMILLFALGKASAQPRRGPATSKIAPEVLADTADGKSASVIVLLADQADVSAGYGMRDQDGRGWF